MMIICLIAVIICAKMNLDVSMAIVSLYAIFCGGNVMTKRVNNLEER